MAHAPHQWDYKTAKVPSPLTLEMEAGQNKKKQVDKGLKGGILWILWIVRARSANRSATQEAPALIIIFDSLMLERSA